MAGGHADWLRILLLLAVIDRGRAACEMREDPASSAVGCMMKEDRCLTNPAAPYLELFLPSLLKVAGCLAGKDGGLG